MDTITIKINNVLALKLPDDPKALNLIKPIKKSVIKEKGKKLSERMAGSFSSGQAGLMRKELTEMRNEWERDSCYNGH